MNAENTSGNGYIRLPEGGVIVPSNGKSSTDRSIEIGQTVISLDLCLDFEQTPRIVLAPSYKCMDFFSASSRFNSVFGERGFCDKRCCWYGADSHNCYAGK